jgi:ubiquinone/menaquinone biosynthesis C-methylase UbiE
MSSDNMRILNVGCGNDTYGTDFIDLYPQREEVVKCNFEHDAFPYEDNTFDKIRCHFVFEHLKDRTHFLKEIYRVLKKGGKLDLRTDNASYWYYALDNKTHTGRYEEASLYGKDDRHFSLFTDHHLINFMFDAGFEEVYTRYTYENARGENLNFRGRTVLFINYILTFFGPLERLAYSEVRVECVK